LVVAMLLSAAAASRVALQEPTPQFGGGYSTLDPRRRQFVDDWVRRLTEITGLKMDAASFYDTRLRLSAKTTFEAATHALMTTSLTDDSGARLGDALDLIERLDAIKGQVSGASSDHQFRIYVVLKENALDLLGRSQEFRRRSDNAVFHKGYPINYREQGGTPSIQISVAVDRRRADIDVDYRSATFPVSMFNGHLSSSNSDVRAGSNYDRHVNRWVGFQNWWRNFFGVRVSSDSGNAVKDQAQVFPAKPRVGDKPIDAMVQDFLKAWLIDGDTLGAMGYISERAYACLAVDSDDPAGFDRGMAPFQLAMHLKAAHDAVGKRATLEGLTVGVRLTRPTLRVVKQPHHAQFVIYSVPDDAAAAFDCENRLKVGDPGTVSRTYGNYFGSTFYIAGPVRNHSVVLLWGREHGYWKIVSWQAEPEGDDLPTLYKAPDVKIVRIKADASFVAATRGFLESWLVRKDYDAAFRYLSPESYGCYDLVRGPDEPRAASPEDAGRRIRAALERSGTEIGTVRGLDAVLSAADPTHPAVRVMDHPYSRTFTLASVPTGLAVAANCAALVRGDRITGDVALEYGTTFGLTMRFKTKAGETPVLRSLWTKDATGWRLIVFDVEMP